MFKINDSIKFQEKDYVISEFLGQGGMGHVFKIENMSDGSSLAMKSLQYFLPDDDNYRSLFNEWEQAQTVKHENVINYVGFHNGLSDPQTPYLVMELANGGSLEDFLKSKDTLLSESECLDIFHQIINGMEAVNNVLVHRDIKPDNIFINNGIFKIADFGLAKVAQDKTRSRTFKGWGTEPYIAPEAYRSEQNTIQMDMYSIGHVFYQIAALKHAYGNPDNWEEAHFTAVPESLSVANPNISAKVSAVINKLIAKRPSNRYGSWDSVRQDLHQSAQNITENKDVINKILGSKVSRDLEQERILSEQQKLASEQKRKSDILDFQFNNEIVMPLKNFVDNFNDVSGSNSLMKLTEHSSPGGLSCHVSFDGKSVNIRFDHISERDVMESYGNNIWGERVQHRVKPSLMQKLVLGWGAIECIDGRGLNIVLVESDQDDYGDWYVLKNNVSALSREQRPDPFAFSGEELLKEIHLVSAMHIYDTEVKRLDIKEILEFISSAL
ncbi:serine/threonine-protein kinase [Providencia manganoxydans]